VTTEVPPTPQPPPIPQHGAPPLRGIPVAQAGEGGQAARLPLSSQERGLGGEVFRWIQRHPDLVAILLVALVALTVRSAFAFRVPAFVTKDSIEYVEPALALVDGGQFALAQRRTPVYPIVMAGSVALFGRDLLAITFAQHLLGVGTAIFTYGIGRLAFGRAAGLLAGLLAGLGAALSSPLLIYEHYLITESVFTFFLILSILLLVAGLRTERMAFMAAGGLALGLAALTRPVGQAVLVALPIAALYVFRSWRPSLAACALAGGCFALLVVPWAIRNQVVYGTAGAASTGRFLISRSVKHERNFVFYEDAVGAYPGEAPERTRARKIAQEVTDKRPEPGQIFQRIRDNLGLTEAQTDAMLKDIALEAILRDPMLWVSGTIEMFYELLKGAPKEEEVHWHQEVHEQPRVANQWGQFNHLLEAPPPAHRNEAADAEILGALFRPSRVAWWIVGLGMVGALLALVVPAYRPAVLPFLVSFVLIAVSAMLVGDVPRYRYPVDPLMYVMAAGGLVGLVGLVMRLTRRRAAGLTSPPTPLLRGDGRTDQLAPPLRADTGIPRSG
jgi:4-amino-4-deoxy-L-arabinose transferase-like glycosyltransferase